MTLLNRTASWLEYGRVPVASFKPPVTIMVTTEEVHVLNLVPVLWYCSTRSVMVGNGSRLISTTVENMTVESVHIEVSSTRVIECEHLKQCETREVVHSHLESLNLCMRACMRVHGAWHGMVPHIK